jgi:glutaryl-CoA dehydrogenase
MSEFQGVDFFNLDHLFTDEERAIRDTVREFVDRELLDNKSLEKHHRAGTFPMDFPAKAGDLGLLGPTIEGYGCLGINKTSYGLIMQELERADSGIRSFCSVQGSLCMYPIYAFGSEEQKERYLPGMAKGEIIGCFGLSEPDHGSDPGGMETKATPDGDGGWVLNGTKRWITNGTIAHIAIVWARTPDGIRGFLVPTDTPGFTAPLIEGKFSLRASVTSELIMEDVKLGADALLPNTGGLKNALMCLTQARYGIAWGVAGSAMAVYDEALSYTKSRSQFDTPLAAKQLVQRKLVQMFTLLTNSQLISYHLGRLMDEGKAKHYHVSYAKRHNCAAARDVARMGRELLGANGVCDEYQAMRHMMNIESVYTYEGTHEIHTLVLGEHVTGLPAYR